jgi:hypothetical protein
MIQLTIARLMAIVLLFGFGFTALRNADPMWASATLTLAILTVSAATVGAIKGGITSTGFAIAGWASLLIWLTLPQSVGDLNGHPRQLLSWALGHFSDRVNPKASGGRDLIHYRQVSCALEVIVTGLAGSMIARLGRWKAPGERSE